MRMAARTPLPSVDPYRRRTGLRRQTVLEVLEYRQQGPEAIVMSAFGPNADWLRNIQARPAAEVIIGSQRFAAVHRFLEANEAVKVLEGYQQRNRLSRPWFISF